MHTWAQCVLFQFFQLVWSTPRQHRYSLWTRTKTLDTFTCCSLFAFHTVEETVMITEKRLVCIPITVVQKSFCKGLSHTRMATRMHVPERIWFQSVQPKLHVALACHGFRCHQEKHASGICKAWCGKIFALTMQPAHIIENSQLCIIEYVLLNGVRWKIQIEN